ncbi:MAG: hypothetical protein U0835_22425 [Isosphaeraceae bacterium]
MSHESHASATPPPDTGLGYEIRDTNVRAVVTFLVGLSLFVVVSQVFLWGLLKALSADKPAREALLTTPDMIQVQRQELNRKEDAALANIERAIDRIADQGLPAPPAGPGKTEAEVNSHSGTPNPPGAPPGPGEEGRTPMITLAPRPPPPASPPPRCSARPARPGGRRSRTRSRRTC